MLPFGNPIAQSSWAYAQGLLRDQAYKGFGLALFVEIFAGILSRAKMLSKEMNQDKNGGFMLAISIEHFLPLEIYFNNIEALCNDLKCSKPRSGFKEILLPGERSFMKAAEQSVHGINLNENTWNEIVAIAKQLNLELKENSSL